jgi:hypothetical protein
MRRGKERHLVTLSYLPLGLLRRIKLQILVSLRGPLSALECPIRIAGVIPQREFLQSRLTVHPDVSSLDLRGQCALSRRPSPSPKKDCSNVSNQLLEPRRGFISEYAAIRYRSSHCSKDQPIRCPSYRYLRAILSPTVEVHARSLW